MVGTRVAYFRSTLIMRERSLRGWHSGVPTKRIARVWHSAAVARDRTVLTLMLGSAGRPRCGAQMAPSDKRAPRPAPTMEAEQSLGR